MGFRIICFAQLLLLVNALVAPIHNCPKSLKSWVGLFKAESGCSLLGKKSVNLRCFEGLASSQHSLTSSNVFHKSLAISASQSLIKVDDPASLPSYSKIGRIKVKGLDFSIPMGSLFLAAVFGWVLVLYPPLIAAFGYSLLFDPKRRRLVDWVIHIWAKMAMLTMLYKPTIRGKENLPPASEAVMYIPNHCSYLDIFTLSGFLPRPFKYVSKIEVLRIPLIGWAMRLAGHVAIERTDKRSQLQTFKDTVAALQDGSSVVTFAEGTRSKDGRLAAFKKGPVKMALKAGVRIVPVSISDLHRWMPDTALVPLGVPRGVVVTVHPPVDPAAAGGEDAAVAAVFAAVNSALPPHQQAPPALLAGPRADD